MTTAPAGTVHRPTRSSYARRWLRGALTGWKGFIGDAGLAIGLVFAFVRTRWSKELESVIANIPVIAGYDELVAILPLAFGGVWIAWRLFATAYRMAVEDADAHVQQVRALSAEGDAERKGLTEVTERLQRRIAELETPAPRVLARFTGDSRHPFTVKNVGAVEAHNVRISDIDCGDTYVAFAPIDPLLPNEPDATVDFRVLDRRPGQPVGLWMVDFSSFLHKVAAIETWHVWRERAGLPPVNDFTVAAALEETFRVGPPRHPFMIRYSDAHGRRVFESEYTWELPWGGRELVLQFREWREVTGQVEPPSGEMPW